jgi:hypothetical protein
LATLPLVAAYNQVILVKTFKDNAGFEVEASSTLYKDFTFSLIQVFSILPIPSIPGHHFSVFS